VKNKLVCFFAQTGRLSVEEAMSFAESTGLTSNVKDQEENMTYNFGVYKHTKDRSRTERYILQFDFNEQALSTIQKGKFGKKIPFDEIRDYDSEVSKAVFPLWSLCIGNETSAF
jgi:hypothetical protein